MESLLLKYRPRSLANVLGQEESTRALSMFVQAPYPTALLLHGESGTGKTSAAYALACELGCAIEEGELGGLHEIASGEMDAQAVRERLNSLRLRPLFGSGWKVCICNEADRMTQGAETIFLDGLEHLPAHCVIVFTTNAPEKLTRRFRDRCEAYAFAGDAGTLQPHIRKLAGEIWRAEVGRGACPGLDELGMPTLGDPDTMHASFRTALQQLSRYIREAKQGGDLGRVRKQLARDCLTVPKGMDLVASCDHCGFEQVIEPSSVERVKCKKCRKLFSVELV
ncbi:MAG TPA: AAA family ATPase [Gemmataceae bacterium]|nr:AAA family ATPase [Gemmataceae bacterium]